MRWKLFVSLGLLSLSAVAGAATAHKTALDKATIEDYVRRLFVWGPQIQVKVDDPKPSKDLPGFLDVNITASAGNASDTALFYVSKDGQKILRGNVYNINASPFESQLDKLNTTGAASFGKPDAPVHVVVFSDFECQYCKEEWSVLKGNIQATFPNDVRVTYLDYPLDAIHPWAHAAALAGRCVFNSNAAAYWDFHNFMFDNQAQITPENLRQKVGEFAAAHSLDAKQIDGCIESRSPEPDIQRSQAMGKALGVNSTPTMFVNGRPIPGGIPWPNLKQIIDFELDYRKAHPSAAADEKCCELTLPTPLKK